MKLMWYDKQKGLSSSMLSKARKLNKLKRIEKISAIEWIVKYVVGYNKTNYNIKEDYQGKLHCNCQFYNKTRRKCSHIIAVLLYEEMNKK